MPQPYDPAYDRYRDYYRLKLVLAFALIIGIWGTGPIFGVDPEGATKVLKSNGFTDIKITGYKWFNGTPDFYNTGFEASGPNGLKMSGNVSRGIFFKGSTIRFD